jgi:hypothetical protein
MAYDDQINDDRVLGNSRIFSYSSLAPIDSSQGLNIEPVQAILGSVLAKLAITLNVGHVQSIYMLNIFLTSLTAVLIFWIIFLLGYSKKTSFTIGIIFGICTIAWPYTRTYFRDPVAMFFLTLAWGAFLLTTSDRYKYQENKYIRSIFQFLIFIGLTLGALSKNTIVLAIPVMIFAFLAKKIKPLSTFRIKDFFLKNWGKTIAAILLIFTILFVWIDLLPTTGIFSRFTFSYYQSVLKNFFSNPHPNFIQAILGPIISPGKSVFLYTPILLLAGFSLFKFFRLVWAEWLFFLFVLAGQALFYDADWWGHVNWGLRYMLPTIPLLLIASAPEVETLLKTRKGLQKLLILGSYSFFVQLTGILVPVRQYYIQLTNSTPPISQSAAIWNPKYSALIWHLKQILSGGSSDLTLSRIGFESIPVFILFILLIGMSISLLNEKIKLRYALILGFVTIFCAVFTLSISRLDPSNKIRTDLAKTEDVILNHFLPGDVILLKSYGTQAWSYWMNWADPNLKWISLPYVFPNSHAFEKYLISNDPSVLLDQNSLSIIQKAEMEYDRIWIVIPEDSPGGIYGWEATYLTRDKRLINYWFISGDDNSTRLYLFETE